MRGYGGNRAMLGKKVRILFLVLVAGGVVLKKQLAHTVFFTLSPYAQLTPLAPEYGQQIASFVAQQQTSFCQVKRCLTTTLHQFPVLKKITLSCMKGRCVVHVQAARPLLVVNEHHVLTDTHQLVDQSVWKQEVLDTLPSVTVSDLLVVASPVHEQQLKKLAYAFHKKYHIAWLDESDIRFQDASEPRITLIGCSTTEPDLVLTQVSNQLKESLLSRKTKGNGLAQWCIDVRFKNQIIVFLGGRA